MEYKYERWKEEHLEKEELHLWSKQHVQRP